MSRLGCVDVRRTPTGLLVRQAAPRHEALAKVGDRGRTEYPSHAPDDRCAVGLVWGREAITVTHASGSDLRQDDIVAAQPHS